MDAKHPLHKFQALFSDAMAVIDVMTTLDWETGQFHSIEVPAIGSTDRKNAWKTYLKSRFEAIIVSDTGKGLSVHVKGRLAKDYVDGIANDFLYISRVVLKGGQSFPEMFRPLFKAYRLIGPNVLGLNGHNYEDPAYKGMAFHADTKLITATQETKSEIILQRTFFRMVGDHLNLPSFDDAMNDYTLPVYRAGSKSRGLLARRRS